MEVELDRTKLKYVLYSRKSTDDPQRQVRSIPDQIRDCNDLINRQNLKVVKRIEETKSAKKPNQRPEFTQMLKDLRKEKYDGIIAWNPDRLARNMKEGGEILDMIDDGYIKDLQFVNHTFSNDANGKMLLGMAFVLSKQFSDDLSQKVTRGMKGNLDEGKSSGTPKHGYIRTEEGLYRPEGKNFELIKRAWEKRRQGISLDIISDYLTKNGYLRITKTGRKIKIKSKILTDVFHDPFYYGVLVQSSQEVDLRNIYNFEPAVSEEGYWEVQSLSNRRIRPYKPHRTAFYPLKAMVLCNYCNRNMYIAPSTGSSGIRYLNARCDTKGCSRTKKSIRMNVLFNFIYEFLEEGLNFTEKEYKEYYESIVDQSEEQREKDKIELHSKQGQLKNVLREIRDIGLSLVRTKPSITVKQIGEQRITELQEEQTLLEKEVKAIKARVSNPEDDVLTIEEFLNLSKNAARVVKAADAVVKDAICRIVFLNFNVDETKVVSYQLKEPFVTLLRTRENLYGRGDTI